MRRASTFQLRSLLPLLLLCAAAPAARATEPAIRFLDPDGNPTERLLVDRHYEVEVDDPAADLDPSVANTLTVPIYSSEWGMEFSIASVFTQETGVDSGIFRGLFRLAAQNTRLPSWPPPLAWRCPPAPS